MAAKSLKRTRESGKVEADNDVKRRCREEDAKLSRLYEDLAAESDEIRLEAAKQILAKFDWENEPSAESVHKTIRRLIRGLCSQRKAARFGFFVTLTELLRQIFSQKDKYATLLDYSALSIIELVQEGTKAEGNVPGVQRRDHLIGRLFGYKSILQSGILLMPNDSLPTHWNQVLDHIYTLARDVPWLREECGLVLIEAVKSLDSTPQSRSFAAEVVERLIAFKLSNTPEGVAVWLTVRARWPDVLPTNVWHDQDPISRKERTRLAKILKEDFRTASEDSDNEMIKSAAANPNPIFAWDVVLSEVLQREEKEFPQFWLDTVDSSLFSAPSSHERKSWGFKLFVNLVTTVADSAIPALFSPNLMRCLINQSKKDVRFLHQAALAALNAVQTRVQESPTSAVAIFTAMSSKHGTVELDRITKTKALEHILAKADDGSLKKIVRHLNGLVLRPGTENQAAADTRRQIIADLLLSAVKNHKWDQTGGLSSDEDHDDWVRKVLDTLIEHAYFVPKQSRKTSKVPLPALSDSTRKIFQERLSSILTRLLTIKVSSRASFALMAVRMIRDKATSSKTLEPIFRADKLVLKTIGKAFRTMDAIADKGSMSRKKSAAEGFLLLYSLALLQAYNGDGDGVLLLNDLEASYKSLKKAEHSGSSESGDAFVEILLTFLGNPRTLFRNIAQEAFTTFTSGITLEGLKSLTDILDTSEDLNGQRELFEQGGDGVDLGSDAEVVEEASDVEMIDGDSQTRDDSEADSSNSDSSSHSDSDAESSTESGPEKDDDNEGEEELARFEKLLANTLQTSKPSLNDDTGTDNDSLSDEDMDDEQMEVLDPALSKIFQERNKTTSKKKQREDAKQTVVQFKSRVLDLLAIYMEKEYSNPLTLELILPVLRRIRAGANKQLTDKSYKLLRTYTDTRSHHKAPLPKPKPEDVGAVWELLSSIHEEAGLGGGSSPHGTACSNASLHVVKILVSQDKKNYGRVAATYAETQKEWFMNKKSTVQPALFTQFQNWSVNARK